MTARRICLLLAVTCAAAAKPLTPASGVDDVLDAMHDRGADLKAFTADVAQTRQNLQFGSTVVRRGHAVFQFLGDGDARMHLVLNTQQKGKSPPRPDKKEYLLDGGWLTDRDYPQQNENRRQLVPPGQKVDLFELGKGPFPLPIGQSKEAVRKQFEIEPVPADPKADPPHTVHLRLKPKPGTSLARQFSQVEFWVDTDKRLPVRIMTEDVGVTERQTNDLTDLKVNPPVGPADFALPKLPGNGWTVSDHPLHG